MNIETPTRWRAAIQILTGECLQIGAEPSPPLPHLMPQQHRAPLVFIMERYVVHRRLRWQ